MEDDRGLSKLILKVSYVVGSQVVGIILKVLKPLRFSPDPLIREVLAVPSIQKLIFKILKYTDAFIFLPRDLATLEALITFIS